MFAAEGGEDYELLAALPPRRPRSSSAGRWSGVPFTRIGSVHAGEGVSLALDGREISTSPGIDHFR